MITGNDIQEISGYLPIDHAGEYICWVRPDENEKFLGWPWGYAEDHAQPFIQIVKEGKVIKSINALDCSEIEFVTETTENKS